MEAKTGQALAIMGGTFDPIHYGHLVAAEEARVSFGLSRVIFVPTGNPPHKRGEIAETIHRYKMTELAIATNPYFEISAIEIDRIGYSYTIDTVKEFKIRYGNETQIYFISGADAILDIMTWKQVDKLLDLCNFIAVTRPGFDLRGLERLDILQQEHEGRLFLLPIPGIAISSTSIRDRVRTSQNIKYLVPEPVENYIIYNGLYR